MYSVEIADIALDAIAVLRAYDQGIVLDGIETQLKFQPDQPTKNRKRLRPNQIAEWELRIGEYRAFYNVFSATRHVMVVAFGCKQGSQLFINGKEFHL